MLLRFPVPLAVLILPLLCLASPARAGEKVTINIYQLPRRDVRNVEEAADLAVMKRFLELHPDINVRGFQGVSAPGVNEDVRWLLAMAGGVAPDVMYVNFRQSDSYISNGFLYPLDEYVKKWAGVDDMEQAPEKLKGIIVPQLWPVIMRPGPDGKKHIWSIPFNGTVVMSLWYRRDLFRAAGLDPDRPPRTWDELYDYAKRLTVPSKQQYGFGVTAGPSASWHFVDLLWSAGGDVMKQDAKGDWRAVYNDDNAVTALRFYQKLMRSGVSYRGIDITEKWDQGKIGMFFQYINEQTLASVNPDVTGIAPLPLGPTGVRGNELNSRMQGINSQITDPKVRDAAWEWVRFRGSDEALRVRTLVFVDAGYAKFINPEHLKRFLPPAQYERYRREVPPGWAEALTEAVHSGRPEPYGKNCQQIYIMMTPPLDAVCLTDRSDTPYLKGLLDQAVHETNEKIIGGIPAGVRTFRRGVALLAVLLLLACFILVFRFVMRSFSEGLQTPVPEPDETLTPGYRRQLGARAARLRFAYLIMAPALLSVALWQYYPLARGSVMAFQDYRLILPSRWTGLDNFAEVLFAPLFWQALWNSARYLAIALTFGFFAPILLALALHEVPKGKVLFRTLYYLPAVTTGLVIVLLWKQFYDKTEFGLLNQLMATWSHGLASLGLHVKFAPIDWLGDPKYALWAVLVPIIWAGMGPGSLIYLAALKGIPDDVYEAADLDGAGILAKLKNVTVPYLRPLIIINFVGAFVGAARAFDFIFVMTGGGPLFSTHVAGLEIWTNAFFYLRFGYAVAMAWIVGALLVGFTLFQLRVLSRVQFKTASA